MNIPSYDDYRQRHGSIVSFILSTPWWAWFIVFPATIGTIIGIWL